MLTGTELGAAIASALEQNGKTQADAARHFGVKGPSVNGWVKTGRISKENFEGLRSWLSLTPDSHWGALLPPMSQTAPMLTAGAAPPPEQYIRLPVLGRAAAGSGQEALGEHIATMDVFIPWFRRVYGRSPAGVSLLTAKGGSMSGVIEDGDVMFVVPVQEFADDGIYIVAIGDLLRVKRLKLRIDGTLAIESTDGSAPELMPLAQVGDTLRIQGRVIGSLGVRKHG